MQKGNEEGKQTNQIKILRPEEAWSFLETQGKFVWLEYREQVGGLWGGGQVGEEELPSMSPL